MSLHQARDGLLRATRFCLRGAQMQVRDLDARTSIVAVEGNVRLQFRDHSLAWLADAVPLTTVTLHEGERFVTPQRGIVSISAMGATVATFLLEPSRAENPARGLIRHATRLLARRIKTRLRRAV